MSTDSKTIIKSLQGVLQHLSENRYSHVPNPEGCKKRASVAVVLRVRPPYKPVPESNGSLVSLDKPETPATSLNHFFSKQWVQDGDAEILFIKRAGRAGDPWSGHTALPGGKRDSEDADDLAAAIRETREETGLDLDTSECLRIGNLPERVVATTGGRIPLMVLCPYIFLLTSRTISTLQPQPSEVAATHWVSLRSLLTPKLRTKEYADISRRMITRGGPLIKWILRTMMGKMVLSAISLIPTESVHASTTPGFIPEEAMTSKPNSSQNEASPAVWDSLNSPSYRQPILLWGLTLGVLADFLDMLPPHNAVKLWKYPTFTIPDLRLLVYLFTRQLRQNNAGDLSSGTWPSKTATDAMTQAIAVPENKRANLAQDSTVGIGGLGVGSSPKHAVGRLLSGYYERMNIAIAVFLVYRTMLGTSLIVWLYRIWRRRRSSNL